MNKKSTVILAFIFNLFLPGLGFHYSGTKHNLGWLRRLGLATMVVFLFAFPLGVLIISPYGHLNYHFTSQEVIAYLTVVLIFGFLGAGVEQKVSESLRA